MTKSIKISSKAHTEIKTRSAKQSKSMIQIVDDLVFIKKIKSAIVADKTKIEDTQLKQTAESLHSQNLNKGGIQNDNN